MSPRLSWRHVIPGLIAVALLAGIVVAIMTLGGVGRIPGEKRTVLVVAAHARGLINGSDVWLAGQKIGVVDAMNFLPPTADSQARLLVIAKVKESVAGQIRRDSKVTIRAGGGFVGPIVLWIDPGTPASPALTERDTLHAQMASELEIAGSRAARALDSLPALMADAKRVIGLVKDPDGVRGAFTESAMAEAKLLVAAMNRSQPAPASERRAQLMANAGAALARVDSIRALLASPSGNVGRFRRDSTLPRTIARVRDELAALQVRMDSSTGTLDRFARDSALTRAVAEARLEMTALFTDVRKRPLRYIAF
jgi:phospholipid/cholesterol/gamma-HCH transport system substrate-binding protein